MNILMVRQELNVGGATEFLLALSAGLEERGHRVTIASSGGAWQGRSEGISKTYTSLRLTPRLRGRPNLVGLAWSISELTRIARRERIDVINTHHRFASLAATTASRWLRVPVVSTMHELRNDSRRVTAASLGTLVVAVSRYAKEGIVERYHLAPQRVRVVGYGLRPPKPIEEADRRLARAEMGLPRRFIVACLGRLVRRKGQHTLLAAAAQLVRAQPDVHVVLIGDGPERASLEAMCRTSGLTDHVTFLGTRTDTHRLLSSADVLVVPSIMEEFGLVSAEGMIAGLPVVASAVGGIPEVVQHGKTGLLVPPADPEALATAILSLARDPSIRHRMGVAGRDVASAAYSYDAWIARNEAVYADALA